MSVGHPLPQKGGGGRGGGEVIVILRCVRFGGVITQAWSCTT